MGLISIHFLNTFWRELNEITCWWRPVRYFVQKCQLLHLRRMYHRTREWSAIWSRVPQKRDWDWKKDTYGYWWIRKIICVTKLTINYYITNNQDISNNSNTLTVRYIYSRYISSFALFRLESCRTTSTEQKRIKRPVMNILCEALGYLTFWIFNSLKQCKIYSIFCVLSPYPISLKKPINHFCQIT